MKAPEKQIIRGHSGPLVRELCAVHQLVLQARARLSHKHRPAQDQT